MKKKLKWYSEFSSIFGQIQWLGHITLSNFSSKRADDNLLIHNCMVYLKDWYNKDLSKEELIKKMNKELK